MMAFRGRVMRGSAFTGLLLGFLAALASFILVAPGYALGQSAVTHERCFSYGKVTV